MQNVVLTVHLILAALLIAVVLLQRSEGGGLGIGGGGGGGGVMTGRQAAGALSRATWGLATAFLITSLILTILAARSAGTGSVIDRIGGGASETAPASEPVGNLPALPAYQPPPAAGQPAIPPVGAGGTVTPDAAAPDPAAPASAAPATGPVTPPAAAVPSPVTPAAPAADAAAEATPRAQSTAAPDAATTTRVITVPVTEPPASN